MAHLQQSDLSRVVSPSSSSSTSKHAIDTAFEPSVEMLVNDFDDERTLEEEEALAATEAEDPSTELSNLKKEGDMPIEELLVLYNCATKKNKIVPANSKFEEKAQVLPAKLTLATAKPNDSAAVLKKPDTLSNKDEEDEEEDIEDHSDLRKLYSPSHTQTTSKPQTDDEEDGDYSPDEDEIKKTIMVGSDFQAVIPEDLCRYDDALPYENEDKLLWNPTILNSKEIEDYLEKYKNPNTKNTFTDEVFSLPLGKHLRDDEQSLFLLLQCGHNMEEALRRRRMNAISQSNTMSLWSEEECRNFESGIRIHGKDFHLIQKAKVRTRSVGELVQFYYIWKKTERHDVFANKARLEKKKYNLHPGLTDYMDRFLEEQENNGSGNVGIRDRSSSPVVHSMMYADSKRQCLDLNKEPKISLLNHQHLNHHNASPKDPLAYDEEPPVSTTNQNKAKLPNNILRALH